VAAVSHQTQPAAAAPAGQAYPDAQQHRSQNSRARQLHSQQQRATLPASLARLMGCAVGPSSSRQQQAKQVHASAPVASWRPGSIKQRINEGLQGKQPTSSVPHAELSHKGGGPAEEGRLRWQQRRPRDPAAPHLNLQRSRQLPADSCADPSAAAAATFHAAAGAACTRRQPAAQGGAHQPDLQPENAMQQPQQQQPDSYIWRKSKRARTAVGPPRTPLGTKRNGASNGSVDFLDEIMPTTGCKRPAAMPAQRPAVPTLRLEAAAAEGTGALISRQRGSSTAAQAAEQKQHTAPTAKPEVQQHSQPHAAGAGGAAGGAAAAPAVRRPLQATPWRRRKSSLDVPGVVVPLLPPLPTPSLPAAPSPPLQHNPQSEAETQPAEADDNAVVQQQQVSTEHPHAATASTAGGSLLYADSVPATQPAGEAVQHGTGPQQRRSANEHEMDDMMDAAPPPDCGAAAAQSADMQQPNGGGSTPLQAAQHSALPPGTASVGVS
jgi:hypothetical protein